MRECVCVMSMLVRGWGRKDLTNKGGLANLGSDHDQPGNDSPFIISFDSGHIMIRTECTNVLN